MHVTFEVNQEENPVENQAENPIENQAENLFVLEEPAL